MDKTSKQPDREKKPGADKQPGSEREPSAKRYPRRVGELSSQDYRRR
jgi:hypothetical protein